MGGICLPAQRLPISHSLGSTQQALQPNLRRRVPLRSDLVRSCISQHSAPAASQILRYGNLKLASPHKTLRGRSGVCQLPWYIVLVGQDTAARALPEQTREVYTCSRGILTLLSTAQSSMYQATSDTGLAELDTVDRALLEISERRSRATVQDRPD